MAIDLAKRVEKVRINLEKKQIKKAPTMRVGLAMDVSGSAEWLYQNGTMQETVSRLLAVAMNFDDNGELDMWSFENAAHRLEVATKDNYERFVQKEIVDNDSISKWHGTSYAPVIQDMLNRYFIGDVVTSGGLFGLFGKPKLQAPADIAIPAYGMLVTDGANNDHPATQKLLEMSQKYPIYWQMVGVGDPKEFTFLREMGDRYPNVGFVNLASLTITDDVLYDKLISDELVSWLKAH